MKVQGVLLILGIIGGASGASAMTCYASQTTVLAKVPQAEKPQVDPAEQPVKTLELTSAPKQEELPTFVTEDIALEKTFVREGDIEVIQFTSPAMKEKNLVISATLNSTGTDVTMLLRDLSANVATGFTGALGKDQSVVANLATALNGDQKMISLTCHAAVAAGNLQPHSPQNF